jgi:hypothetical protein
MLARGSLGLMALLALGGCVEEGEEYEAVRAPSQPRQAEVHCAELPHATPDDSFWLAQAISDANRPPPAPMRQTISLGYVGDEPLSNSVMRDTPIAPHPFPDPFAAMAAPFKSDRWTSNSCRGCGMRGYRAQY